MHYKDGTEAKIGDIARGKGSNHTYPVQGTIIGLTAGTNACNLKILITEPVWVNAPATQTNPTDVARAEVLALGADEQLIAVGATLEYGTVADFELVFRPERAPSGAYSK